MAKAVKRSRRRKEKKHIERGAAHIKSTFNNTIVTTVSYTHLDVYKRQNYLRAKARRRRLSESAEVTEAATVRHQAEVRRARKLVAAAAFVPASRADRCLFTEDCPSVVLQIFLQRSTLRLTLRILTSLITEQRLSLIHI